MRSLTDFQLSTRSVSPDKLSCGVEMLLEGRRIGWFVYQFGAPGTNEFCISVWTCQPTELIAQFRSIEGIDCPRTISAGSWLGKGQMTHD
jgi:hypothetical protein